MAKTLMTISGDRQIDLIKNQHSFNIHGSI